MSSNRYAVNKVENQRGLQKIADLIIHFQNDSKKIFAEIADSYPRLLASLDEQLQNSTRVMGLLDIQGAEASKKKAVSFQKCMHRAEQLVADSNRETALLLEAYNEKLAGLESAISEMQRIDEIIGNIQDFIVDMELISINTLVVAVRAGSAGGAFSFITAEIRKLTESMSIRSRDLYAWGKKIQEQLSVYKEVLTANLSAKKDFLDLLGNAFEMSYSNINAEVNEIKDLVNDVLSIIGNIRKPLVNTMDIVQLQDIPRQSLDHILTFTNEAGLEVVDTQLPNTDELNELDELKFMLDASCFSEKILGDSCEYFQKSLSGFTHNYGQINECFASLQVKLKQFFDHFRNIGGGQGKFEEIFAKASQDVYAVVQNVNQESDISALTETFKLLIADVESELRQISETVQRFRSINIASRIEVARESALASMQTNIDEMGVLIIQIEREVGSVMDLTGSLSAQTKEIVNDIVNEQVKERRYETELGNRVGSIYTDIFQSGENLAGELFGFARVMQEEFIKSFENMERDFIDFTKLGRIYNDLKTQFEILAKDGRQRYEDALQDGGLTEWKVKNDRMKNMIERFTSFAHMKSVDKLGGMEMNEKHVDSEAVHI